MPHVKSIISNNNPGLIYLLVCLPCNTTLRGGSLFHAACRDESEVLGASIMKSRPITIGLATAVFVEVRTGFTRESLCLVRLFIDNSKIIHAIPVSVSPRGFQSLCYPMDSSFSVTLWILVSLYHPVNSSLSVTLWILVSLCHPVDSNLLFHPCLALFQKSIGSELYTMKTHY